MFVESLARPPSKNNSRRNKYRSIIFSGSLDGSAGLVEKGDPNLIYPEKTRGEAFRGREGKQDDSARRSASRANDQRGDDESPWSWVGVRPAGARERGHTSGHASRREIDGDR